MNENSAIAFLGVVVGIVFLLVALASTRSKVTMVLFNTPWFGREIKYTERPRTFIAIVFFYWLCGAVTIIVSMVSALSG